MYARSVAYTLARSRLALAAGGLTTVGAVALVASGALGALERVLKGLPGPPLLSGVGFVLAVALIFRLAAVPFGLYSQFVVERRFGFSAMKPRLWLADFIKGLVLSAAILGPSSAGLLLLMDRAGRMWWLLAAGLGIVLEVLLVVVYPTLIAPLFNRFTPLPEGDLRSRVLGLAAKLGYGVRGIYVMDASRRSRHTNAYFTGLGRSRRIVLYDTLMERVGVEETLAVLAHEIGHARLGHVWKGLVLQCAAMTAGLWVVARLVGHGPLYLAFGLGGATAASALVILALCAGPFTFLLQPLVSLWSRRHEYAADAYSRVALGSGAPLVSALFRLATDNLSNLSPHPLYSFYHYTHPTLAERVAALEASGPKPQPG
jgi:STE24 endopeptidase